jgi:hypothetical protein
LFIKNKNSKIMNFEKDTLDKLIKNNESIIKFIKVHQNIDINNLILMLYNNSVTKKEKIKLYNNLFLLSKLNESYTIDIINFLLKEDISFINFLFFKRNFQNFLLNKINLFLDIFIKDSIKYNNFQKMCELLINSKVNNLMENYKLEKSFKVLNNKDGDNKENLNLNIIIDFHNIYIKDKNFNSYSIFRNYVNRFHHYICEKYNENPKKLKRNYRIFLNDRDEEYQLNIKITLDITKINDDLMNELNDFCIDTKSIMEDNFKFNRLIKKIISKNKNINFESMFPEPFLELYHGDIKTLTLFYDCPEYLFLKNRKDFVLLHFEEKTTTIN